jgi:uncharacterized damage-inducible protein DinB
MSLKNLALYHHWVGEKSREILKTLSEEEFRKEINETIGSVRQKVEHIIHALLFCFHTLKVEVNHSGTTFKETIQNIAQLNETDLLICWQDLDKRLSNAFITDNTGTVEIQRKDGNSFCLKRDDFYLQYLLHTVYHRGQLNYCLKALNKPPINGDYLFYFDEVDTALDDNV